MGLFGLFGHKKHVYVFWCRFNDAADVRGGNEVIQQLGTKEVAMTIEKVCGRSFNPKNMHILNDLLVNSYSKPMTESYAKKVGDEAWKIASRKFHDEIFDKSKEIDYIGGVCDLTIVPALEKYGLFLTFIEA